MNRPIHAPVMTQEEAAERLVKAFGPFFTISGPSGNVELCEEGVFSLRLIKALNALGLIEIR